MVKEKKRNNDTYLYLTNFLINKMTWDFNNGTYL